MHASIRFYLASLILWLAGGWPPLAKAAEPMPLSRAASADGPIGWASVEGGTTGGQGGKVVVVKDAKSFAEAVKLEGPLMIHVFGPIQLQGSVRVEPRKTILGMGSDAKISGGGLRAVRSNQIIIRNVAISGAKDAIDIESSHHVWIDHCDLSNCTDGLIDIKRGSDYVTVSWNHFHDHDKTTLVGHSDKDEIRRLDAGHLRVTYHHNYFDGTRQRHPRVRFAEPVHVFNNYFLRTEHGVNSVMDAGVFVEGNHFEGVRFPTEVDYGDSPEPGRLVEQNNVYEDSGEAKVRGAVDAPSAYYRYKLDDAKEVRQIVKHGAGVGKLELTASPVD